MSKLKRNIFYNVFYQFFSIVMPLILTPYLVRVLTKDQIGLNSYGMSLILLFVYMSFFGINNYGIKVISSSTDVKDRNTNFWSLWTIQIVSSILSFILFIFFIWKLLGIKNIVFFVQSFLVLINMLDVSWFFVGIEEMKKTFVRNILVKILSTSFIFIFVRDNSDFYIYVLINVFSTLFGNLVLIGSVKKYISKPVFCKNTFLGHIKVSWKFLLPQISGLIYMTLDKLILGSISGMTQLAYYEQSNGIIRLSANLISCVGVVLLPVMSKLVVDNNEVEFEKVFTISIKNILFASFYVFTMIICVSPSFVEWFFSNEYKSITILIQIGSLIGIFVPISTLLWNSILIPRGMDNISIKSSLYCAILNLILNSILDRYIGALGAIISIVLTEFFCALYRLYYCKNYYNFNIIKNNIIRYSFISIVIFSSSLFINIFFKSTFITSLLLLILYSFLYISMLFLLKDDLLIKYLDKIKCRYYLKK